MEDRFAALAYKRLPRIYTAIAIVIALALNIAGRYAEPLDPFAGADWRQLLVYSLMQQEGFDPYHVLQTNVPAELLALAQDAAAELTPRSAALLRLASASGEEGKTLCLRYLKDEQAPLLLRMASAYSLALAAAPDTVDDLEGTYRRSEDDVLRVHCLFALKVHGSLGHAALRTIVLRERKKAENVFFDFDIDGEIQGIYAEFLRNHQLRVTIEKLRLKRYQYFSLPILTVLGALGAIYPPLLLCLLPMIVYPYTATMGAWFLLLYITLSNVAKRPSVKLAFSLGIAIVVVACIESLASVFNFSLFGLFVLWNIDVHVLQRGQSNDLAARLRGLDGGRASTAATDRPRSGDGSAATDAAAEDAAAAENDPAVILVGMLEKGGAERKEALAMLQEPSAAELLEPLLAYESRLPHEDVLEEYAIEALGHFEQQSAYNRLKELLLSHVTTVKMAAIDALSGRHRTPELLSIFAAMAHEKNYDLRIKAMHAVAEYGYDSAKEILERLVDDDDERISSNARLVLRRLRVGIKS